MANDLAYSLASTKLLHSLLLLFLFLGIEIISSILNLRKRMQVGRKGRSGLGWGDLATAAKKIKDKRYSVPINLEIQRGVPLAVLDLDLDLHLHALLSLFLGADKVAVDHVQKLILSDDLDDVVFQW